MHLPFSFVELRHTLSAHTTALSVAGVFGLLRKPLAAFRPFGLRDSESLMNFSSLGTLRCVCGAEHSASAKADRRHFCRACGCEVVAQDQASFNKVLSKAEITAMTRSLRRAAIRASHLELPPSITTVAQLHQYLDSAEPKRVAGTPTRTATAEIPQLR